VTRDRAEQKYKCDKSAHFQDEVGAALV
jgi:hypothetical protein